MPRVPGRPLTADLIARTAIAIIDDHSMANLTMRRLAAELGVDPMALYRHVANKEALLRVMGDAILSQVLDGVLARPDGDVVRTSARELYRHLVAHPARLTVLATAPTTVVSAGYTLHLARELTSRGIDEERAVGAMRAAIAYVFGAALLTVSAQTDDGAGVTGAAVARRLERYGDPVDPTSVQRMLDHGLDVDIDEGLDAILRGFLG